ncbi:hypothetical protein [Candidatus Terasakiella magnetica]|nr:hypothetical protein [Candidatus Terasakiella magnetica]
MSQEGENLPVEGDVLASLDEWRRHSLNEAVEEPSWTSKHPINIRLSIPFIKKQYYLTIVGGREKRSQERRFEERSSHPLRTFMNMLFALGVVSGATVLMLVFLALYSSIIEF